MTLKHLFCLLLTFSLVACGGGSTSTGGGGGDGGTENLTGTASGTLSVAGVAEGVSFSCTWSVSGTSAQSGNAVTFTLNGTITRKSPPNAECEDDSSTGTATISGNTALGSLTTSGGRVINFTLTISDNTLTGTATDADGNSGNFTLTIS